MWVTGTLWFTLQTSGDPVHQAKEAHSKVVFNSIPLRKAS